MGVKFGVNWGFHSPSVMVLWKVWRGDKKCLRVGVNPLGGGSYICVRLILGRII